MARFLPVAVKNSGVSLEELLPDAISERPSLVAFELVSKLYRQIAVGSFLMSGNPQDLAEGLFKSARAFAHFSEVAPEGEKLTSRAEAFFDAVACHDDEGARRIIAASPKKPDPSREYEEDFYKVRFAMDLWSGAPRGALDQLLAAWTALATEPDPYADLYRAMLDKDQKAFDEALEKVIEARQEHYEHLKQKERLDGDEGATLPHLSTEILALLDLAERAGLRTARDYPLAPGLARKLSKPRFPPEDSWKVAEGWSDFT